MVNEQIHIVLPEDIDYKYMTEQEMNDEIHSVEGYGDIFSGDTILTIIETVETDIIMRGNNTGSTYHWYENGDVARYKDSKVTGQFFKWGTRVIIGA